jgi:hypothetical protein
MKAVTIKLAAVLIAAAGVFSSCNKIVTPKKLDGDWSVTSGTSTSSTTYTSGSTSTTYTSNSTFNGSTLSQSTTEGGITTTVSSSMSIDYSFDRKTGEYTSVVTVTDPEYSENTYQVYDDVLGNYAVYMIVERRTSRVSTTTEEGFYTITGDAGDELEKNSQITFQERSSTETYTDSYSYFQVGTTTAMSVSGKYYYDWNTLSYMPFTGKETVTGENSYAMIWNVTDLNKDEMNIEFSDIYNYSDGSSSSTSSSETSSWTLTQN